MRKKSRGQSAWIPKNKSLRKALQILEEMTRSPGRIQDIAQSLEIPQTTLQRFLNTYAEYGYVRQDPKSSWYYLTLKLSHIGAQVQDIFPFQRSLSKYVREAAALCQEATALSMEDRNEVVYIDSVAGSSKTLQARQRIGQILPLHATAAGKLHLLNFTEERIRKLEGGSGLARCTPRTITQAEALIKEIRQVRDQDYAVEDEEYEEGVRSFAVPLRDFSGRVAAGLVISAPTVRLTLARIAELVPLVHKVAFRAEIELGRDAGKTLLPPPPGSDA